MGGFNGRLWEATLGVKWDGISCGIIEYHEEN